MTDETTTQPYMQLEHEPTGTIARWRGGEYIELGWLSSGGEFHAENVINTFTGPGYTLGEEFRTNPFSAFREAVERHFAERDEED